MFTISEIEIGLSSFHRVVTTTAVRHPRMDGVLDVARCGARCAVVVAAFLHAARRVAHYRANERSRIDTSCHTKEERALNCAV